MVTTLGPDRTQKNRILNYSNPDVRCKGMATGTQYRNNAQQIRASAKMLANYVFNPNPPLSGNLVGPFQFCHCGGASFYVLANCGNPSYNYQWFYSYDGINYASTGSNYYIYNHMVPCTYTGDWFFIKVIVTDASGNSITLYQPTRTVLDPNNMACFVDPEKPGFISQDVSRTLKPNKPIVTKANEFSLYPVPSNKNFTLSFNSNLKELSSIEIISTEGKILSKMTKIFNEGLNNLRVDLSNFRSGSYLVVIRNSQGTFTKTFIIQN